MSRCYHCHCQRSGQRYAQLSSASGDEYGPQTYCRSCLIEAIASLGCEDHYRDEDLWSPTTHKAEKTCLACGWTRCEKEIYLLPPKPKKSDIRVMYESEGRYAEGEHLSSFTVMDGKVLENTRFSGIYPDEQCAKLREIGVLS